MILFDGVCNLCSGFVQFIIARDPAVHFRFAALQSPAAARVLAMTNAQPSRLDSIVLVEHSRVSTRSTAVLRIARGLRFPWSLAYGFVAVPRPIRDAVYDFVARHRYRWFGQREACMVPTAELRARFLEMGAPEH